MLIVSIAVSVVGAIILVGAAMAIFKGKSAPVSSFASRMRRRIVGLRRIRCGASLLKRTTTRRSTSSTWSATSLADCSPASAYAPRL